MSPEELGNRILHQHNTQTQENIMSKNPYEIRLETLKMAKEMADQQFNLQMDFMFRMMDQSTEEGKSIKDAFKEYPTLAKMCRAEVGLNIANKDGFNPNQIF